MSRLEELSEYFNISPDCSENEMYRAYRELRIQYHPDKPNGDIDKYNEVCKNFEELVNICIIKRIKIMERLAPIASENPNYSITWDELEQWMGGPVDYSPYYEILNLNEDFTKEDLEKAYKKARIKYHPDKSDGDKDKFELATEAYLKLKDLLWYKN